jgi:hypothetical protein
MIVGAAAAGVALIALVVIVVLLRRKKNARVHLQPKKGTRSSVINPLWVAANGGDGTYAATDPGYYAATGPAQYEVVDGVRVRKTGASSSLKTHKEESGESLYDNNDPGYGPVEADYSVATGGSKEPSYALASNGPSDPTYALASTGTPARTAAQGSKKFLEEPAGFDEAQYSLASSELRASRAGDEPQYSLASSGAPAGEEHQYALASAGSEVTDA